MERAPRLPALGGWLFCAKKYLDFSYPPHRLCSLFFSHHLSLRPFLSFADVEYLLRRPSLRPDILTPNSFHFFLCLHFVLHLLFLFRRFWVAEIMCVKDGDQMVGDFESKGSPDHSLVNSLLLDAVPDKLDSICENTTLAESRSSRSPDFAPILRSGEWSDQGTRQYMEDTHVCIADLAQRFGFHQSGDVVAFFGVFDGHGGKEAASFVRDNLPRIIVEDADFPLELEKIVLRSFMQTDERTCSLQSSLNSGTTVLTAMIFGRSLLVANAGDCRAVLSRVGVAIEMSNDHKPDCLEERKRVISLGGFIDNEGYLNGELGVTRALGDWHIEGMKSVEGGGPLSAEPELKLVTLTKEDEFLIIGSDGLWEVFTNQIAVDFVRRRLQEHNDTKRCCRELGVEAIKRGARDNVTVVLVAFHKDPLAPFVVKRSRPRRSISAEGLQSLRCSLSLKG